MGSISAKGEGALMRQALDFKLIRSGQLNTKELGVLCYINSHRDYCFIRSLVKMAEDLQTSERTLRRIINSLVSKGLIKKAYRCFKRLSLTIVSLDAQKALRGAGMVAVKIRNDMKSLIKSSHRPKRTGLIRPLVSEPKTKERMEKEKGPNDFEKDLGITGMTHVGSVESLISGFLSTIRSGR